MTAIFDGGDFFSQSVTTGTDIGQATLSTDGVWFSAWVYVSATPGQTYIVTLSDGSSSNIFGLGTDSSGNPRAVFRRASGAYERAIAASPLSAGWHLCTVWIREGTTAGRLSLSIWVDGATVVETLNELAPSIALDTFPSLYVGALGANDYFTGNLAGVAFGTGNPASAHAYAWNGGSAQEITGYNFAGDAGATLDGYYPLDKEGTDTVDTGDVEVQDAVASLDSWSFTGAPVWDTTTAPFNSAVTPETGTRCV